LLCERYNIAVHADLCLGAFINQFMNANPLKINLNDQKWRAIATWSADLHKYGDTHKGLSFIGVRKELIDDKASLETICQPRSTLCLGVGVACMLQEGQEGYEQRAQNIVALGAELITRLKDIEELELVGRPFDENIPDWVIAFRLKEPLRELSYTLAHLMTKLSWHIKQVGDHTLHFALTSAHTYEEDFVDLFIQDLSDVIEEIVAHPTMKKTSSVALYGLAADLPYLDLGQQTTKACLKTILQLYAENIVSLRK
jgi:glutamate/tyrosine decarboxylase-like PLP-dependent enzyme